MSPDGGRGGRGRNGVRSRRWTLKEGVDICKSRVFGVEVTSKGETSKNPKIDRGVHLYFAG